LTVPLVPASAEDAAHVLRLEHRSGESACGAALIDRDLIVTAAHCVRPDAPAQTLRFGDTAVETRAVQRHPVYGTFWDGARRWRYDIALVALSEVIAPARRDPLQVGAPPRIGEMLALETWRMDAEGPLRRDCPVLAIESGLAILGCVVASGDSGGPVTREGPGGAEIVAVAVARAGQGDASTTVAAPLAPSIAALMEALDRP
jgi:hypothetical protein